MFKIRLIFLALSLLHLLGLSSTQLNVFHPFLVPPKSQLIPIAPNPLTTNLPALPTKFDPKMMQNPRLFQGDITGPMPDDPHFAKGMDWFLWPGGIIYFKIHQSLAHLTPYILEAMQEIQATTCIRFQERTIEKDFVTLFMGQGCFAHVGRRGGNQKLSLGRGCENHGIIVHELMHVIGFYHLHQRYDRDRYLRVHWQNINPMFLSNFKLLSPNDKRVDADFDYNSIMLYGSTSFSKNTRFLQTMTPTIHGYQISDPGQKGGLTTVDAYSVNRLYKCG